MGDPQRQFVSRAGLKLEHALREFCVDVAGFVCADFGCNIGGFTDCLLQHGAARVVAIDTGYGVLDWKLRNDPRVVVMERTNVLHAAKPQAAGSIDLVVIDLAWTPQRHSIPAALRWLAKVPLASEEGGQGLGEPDDEGPAHNSNHPSTYPPASSSERMGRIITLIKPHYELGDAERRELLHDGVLAEDEAERICTRVLCDMPSLGVEVIDVTRSPITGGKSGKNIEFLALLRPR